MDNQDSTKCDANDVYVQLGAEKLGQQIEIHLNSADNDQNYNKYRFHGDDELSIILNKLVNLIQVLDFEQLLQEYSGSDGEFNSYKQAEGKIKITRTFKIVAIIDAMLRIALDNNMEIVLLSDNLNDERKIISVYNGSYFIPIPEKICRTLLKYVAIQSTEDGDHNYRNYKFVNELYSQFIEECSAKKRYQHSTDRVLLNLANCTIEFSKKNHFAVLLHNPQHYLCHQLPFSYDQNAVSRQWLQYLLEVLGDQECSVKDLTIEQLKEYCKNNQSIQLLKEFCGAILARWINLQYIMFLYGKGSNGKSCFMNVLTEILGRFNISSISLENFNKDCYLAELDNKLLNCNSDVEGTIKNKATVKKVASREIIDAKKLYHSPKPIDNYGRVMFNTNEMPRINNDVALSNRLKCVVFDKVFDAKTANTDLHTQLIATELSAIFNWFIEGYNDICENNKNGKQFSECKKSDHFLQDYRNSQDIVMLFMGYKGYKVGSSHKVPLTSLLHDYGIFCREHKFETNIITCKQLSQYLQKKLGYKAEKKDGDNTKIFYDIIDDDIVSN